MSNTSKNHIAIPIAPLSNNDLSNIYNVNNLLTPRKNGNTRNNKNALLTPNNYNASLNGVKNRNNSLKIRVGPAANNNNYLPTPTILTPSNYEDLLTPNANYNYVNARVPLKNANNNNRGTRKIKFNPNANVREYMSNTPFTIHQGPKSNTAKKWKNKGSPKIYKRVPNSWNEKVAHLAAMVYTKNNRNNMITNLRTNPYVNSIIKNYYNEELAKEREQMKRNKMYRRNNNSVNNSSNNNSNSNNNNKSVTNDEIMNIYKNDMIKDVIDHLNQKNRVSEFN
jgi:hypothetical protein